VLLALALSDKATVEDAADGSHISDVEAAHDRVPLLSTVGGVMLGVGVVGAAACVTWIVLSGDERPVEVRAGIGHLSVRGSF
jgi:hypothetical protein